MINPFRTKFMRANFDAVVAAYETKHKDLVRPDGTRHKGNSWATTFWRGYDNVLPGSWDAESRKTAAYAVWRAGRAIAEKEKLNQFG